MSAPAAAAVYPPPSYHYKVGDRVRITRTIGVLPTHSIGTVVDRSYCGPECFLPHVRFDSPRIKGSLVTMCSDPNDLELVTNAHTNSVFRAGDRVYLKTTLYTTGGDKGIVVDDSKCDCGRIHVLMDGSAVVRCCEPNNLELIAEQESKKRAAEDIPPKAEKKSRYVRVEGTYFVRVESIGLGESEFALQVKESQLKQAIEDGVEFALAPLREYQDEALILDEWIKDHGMKRTGEELKAFGPYNVQKEAGNNNKKLVCLWLHSTLGADGACDNDRRIELEDGTFFSIIPVTHSIA